MSKRTLALFLLPATAFCADAPIPDKPEYNRDVRPILADACFRCHGFDKHTREGGRRLDTREGATELIDGIRGIVPGNLKDSELHSRIYTTDEDDIMPPKKANRQLSAREKAILDRWVEQGAEYQEHWAYIPPTKSAPPDVKAKEAKNAIDAFVFARQEQVGFKRVGEADRATLLRRVYLDLTGLPPKPAEIEAFVKDTAPDAYERVVDRLIASPHFGERMTVWWLDLVRYADTVGYHGDVPRNVSPYRDYVIRAFNEGMPFDKFTIEQLAGDLLPEPTVDQKVASAYNRLILTTEEGGAQAGEYEAKHVTDRVKSIGTTWLAQTYMCCECHDHKYDPVKTRDFYALGAFFADIKEPSIGKLEAGMPVAAPEQVAELKAITAKAAKQKAALEAPFAEVDAAQAAWEKTAMDQATTKPWTPLHPAVAAGEKGTQLAVRPDNTIEASGAASADVYRLEITLPAGATAVRLDALPNAGLPGNGPGRASNGNFVLNEFTLESEGKPLKIAAATATFEQGGTYFIRDSIDGKTDGRDNGWAVLPNTGKEHSAFFELDAQPTQPIKVVAKLYHNWGDNHMLGKFRLSVTTAPKPVRMDKGAVPADVLAALKVESDKRNPKQKHKVTEFYRSIAPQFAQLRQEMAETQKTRDALMAQAPLCLVTETIDTPRTVRILPRGDWTKKDGEIVQPATPGYLPGAPKAAEGQRLTRLDLAKWLVSRQNPLTARVFVNRMWKLFYGMGLSKSLEDLGTQGEVPMNQPLLDWMAVEFMDSGWNVKHMARLMVTSETYRLASTAPKELLAKDPFNRELARGGRWRLDAEFVRDNALSIAGLMVDQVGGPSVKPYQPPGYWENLNFPVREWDNSKDKNQWRRGLYTWWQRSYLQPSMLAFDAPTREECCADRTRSNIPQQALALLNDVTYVEAARALAARMLHEAGSMDKIAWGFREATGRMPTENERAILADLQKRHLELYVKDPEAAKKLVSAGYTPVPNDVNVPEYAAWTSVARAILNLHETITRL